MRKLVGIETSGSLNILFTDKTGTLTRGRLEVSPVCRRQRRGVPGCGRSETEKRSMWEMTRLSCYYNNESLPSAGEVIGGNATDRALMSYILGRQTLPNGYTVTSRIPFDSARKWAAAEIAAGSVRTPGPAGNLRGCAAGHPHQRRTRKAAGCLRPVHRQQGVPAQA